MWGIICGLVGVVVNYLSDIFLGTWKSIIANPSAKLFWDHANSVITSY